MDPQSPYRARDPIVGILCAVCAVGLGILHMVMGDAPARMIVINVAAVLVGLGLCLWLAQSRPLREGRLNLAVAVMGATLLATALFGVRAEGASRWIPVAGLVIQPTLLFIPLMLMLHARRNDAWTAAGLALSIVATASQPDRAMAGVLFAALTALALKAPDRRSVVLALAAAVGFVVTVFRPDRGGVSAFVDRILFTGFEVHPLAGMGLALGALLLVVPALRQAISRRDPSTALVFGVTWSGIVVAALLGNYPTPLVGYGGSAIVGYLLSVAVLGAGVAVEAAHRAPTTSTADARDVDAARVAVGL